MPVYDGGTEGSVNASIYSMSMNVRPILLLVLLLSVFLVSDPSCASGDDVVWAVGKVVDASGRHPIAGAVVAVYDRKNRVIDYVKTDSNGEYAVALSKSVLNLPKRKGGFLHQVSRTVNSAVSGAGGLIGAPVKAGIRAAASVVGTSDPLLRAGIGAATGLVNSIIDIVTGAGATHSTLDRKSPGVVTMRVAASKRNDVAGLGRVYWMQEEIYRVGGGEKRAYVAWLDPVRLGGEKDPGSSRLTTDFLSFTEAKLDPPIAERGQEVTMTVTLKLPEEPRTPVIVVGRHSRTGAYYELEPIGNDEYQCRFTVDRRYPRNDQVITVIAYAAQDLRLGRSLEVEKALARAGYWDPKRRFVYNPIDVATRNRVELTLTVLDSPEMN